MKVESVVRRNSELAAGIQVFPQVGLCNRSAEWAVAGQSPDDRRVEGIVALSKHRHCQLVTDYRSAHVALKVLPLIRQFLRGIELHRIQRVIAKVEIEVAAHPACTRLRNNFNAAKAGPAVFR